MASSKLTALTENTSPALEDLLYLVDDPSGTPVERKVTIENLLNLLSSGNLVDRGDPSAVDFDETDLTEDGSYYDLDLSSIVPAGATFVYLKIYILDDAANSTIRFRKNGNSNTIADFVIRTQVANVSTLGYGLVPLDANGVIEYNATNTTWSGIQITVLGWSMGGADISFDYAPNELINGEFVFWQEASTIDSTTTPANNDDTYICDQWILLSDGNDVVDVSRGSTSPPTGSKYFLHSEVETINKKFGFFQPIENLNSLKYTGEKASLSFQVKGTLDNCRAAIISWDGTADTITSDIVSAWNAEGTDPTLVTNWTYENTPSNIALTTSWVEHKIENISIDTSGMTNIGIFIWADDTDGALSETLEIGKVKLELNSVCTKFVPLPILEEIRRCQRFFEKSYNLETDPGASTAWSNSWQLQSYSANMVGFHIQYEVRKRNTAAVVVYSPNTGDSGKVYDGAGDENSDDVDEGESGFLVRNDGTVTSFISCHWTANSRL